MMDSRANPAEMNLIEVSSELFDYMNDDKDSDSFTWGGSSGKAGVMVFKTGTAEDIMKKGQRNAEEAYGDGIKKQQAKARAIEQAGFKVIKHA